MPEYDSGFEIRYKDAKNKFNATIYGRFVGHNYSIYGCSADEAGALADRPNLRECVAVVGLYRDRKSSQIENFVRDMVVESLRDGPDGCLHAEDDVADGKVPALEGPLERAVMLIWHPDRSPTK